MVIFIWGDRGNVSLMSELQMLQNKAACLILDLPVHSSATEALKKLGWKPLLRRRMEHHAIFMYKLLNNHFCILLTTMQARMHSSCCL